MRSILLLTLFSVSIYANYFNSIQTNVKKAIQNDEQRKIFNKLEKNKQTTPSKLYKSKKLKLTNKKDQKCIEIKSIKVLGSTIYTNNDFKKFITPLLNNCQGISNLNNLSKKISNLYINDGYVTSRAYIKPQDLSKGNIKISILEGKVEKIISKEVNFNNLYLGFKNKILNIRDIEVAIQQAQRLASQNVKLELIPGSKTGYTIVKVLGKKTKKRYNGYISLNNFGSEQTGKYQISSNINYENLLDLSDIISLSLNETNHALKDTDTFGSLGLSYSIPLQRALFNFSYYKSRYEQLNKDEFGDIYKSQGDTNNYLFNMDYKLYHDSKNMIETNIAFEYKKSNNFLNDVKLEIQSYKLSVLNLGFKYILNTQTLSLYSMFSFYKGLHILGAKDNFAQHDSTFSKYVLDLGLTKYFQNNQNTKYDLSFRGQSSKDKLFGTEEISMGGPYSVRGFKESGLSGNTGFYVRNELSNTYKLSSFAISPFIAIDYGYAKKDEDNIYGSIVGSAIGLKTSYKNSSFEIFYSKHLKEPDEIEGENKGFLGIKLSYSF